jgi:hypothetical protein
VVTLRVDVAAANARREFNSASRAVNGFSSSLAEAERDAARLDDEMQAATRRMEQADREFQAAARAADHAGDEVQRLTAQVAALGHAAPQALVDELQRAEDQLRDCEREEQRLLDAVNDTTAEANRLGRAFNDAGDRVQHITRQLAEARREADRLRAAMDRANRQANNPLRGAQRGLLGFRQQINQMLSQNPGTSLRDAMSSAWQALPVELKGVVIAVGASLAAIFATAAGAAINGLLLAAIGGGVLAVMAAVAAKTSNVVQAAFRNVFTPVIDQIKTFSMIAEGPLVKSAHILGQAWSDVSDDIRGMFQDVGPEITDLADGIGGFVRGVMPGLREAVAASVPILKELARDLPALGDSVSEMFAAFARGGEGAQKGFRALLMLVSGSLIIIGNVVEFLSNKFNQITTSMQMLTEGLSKIPLIGHLFEGAADFWRSFNDLGEGSVRSLDATGEAADNTGLALGRQADATNRASQAAQVLSRKMSDLVNTELGAKEASIAFEAALDAVTESAKEHGRSLDIGSEKGRANAETILAGVRAAEAKREADIALAGGERASAAAVAEANAKYEAQVQQIRAAAKAAGFDQQQVEALIGSLGRIPKNVTTRVTTEYRTVGSIPADQRVGSGNIRGYATGGTPPPGFAWAGEHGPELIDFTGRERVYNAMESARIMGTRAARSATLAARSAAPAAPATVQVQLVQSSGRSATGLDALFGKWLDDALFNGRLKWRVVDGRVRPA